MLAALAEPLDAVTSNQTNPSTARAEASRANGKLSRGPTSVEGKERSRRNGCKEGLTGKGIVLPPDAGSSGFFVARLRRAGEPRGGRPATPAAG
jgi:hypothetical protein